MKRIGIGLLIFLAALGFGDARKYLGASWDVDVQVSDGSKRCDKDYPLLVSIKNNSPRTITFTKVYLSVHQPGHSKDLAAASEYDSNRTAVESDLIILPGQNDVACWRPNSGGRNVPIAGMDVKLYDYRVYF